VIENGKWTKFGETPTAPVDHASIPANRGAQTTGDRR